MTIGIDISQTQYEKTGVGNYLLHLVESMIERDTHNMYVLFFSSLRGKLPLHISNLIDKYPQKVSLIQFPFPQSVLDFLWNKIHILPIEILIGKVDWFITSDWVEPPTRHAKKATILYDLIVYKYPEETHISIHDVQKRKLQWVKKETDLIFCISESTKKDAIEILGLQANKLKVAYPGLVL